MPAGCARTARCRRLLPSSPPARNSVPSRAWSSRYGSGRRVPPIPNVPPPRTRALHNGNSRQKLRYHTHNLAEAVPPQPPQPQAGRLLLPLSAYRVSSHYGLRMHPIKKRLLHHSGVDFAAPYGSPIKAAQAGYVIFAGAKGGYGNAVVVQHNPRFATLYGHAAKLLVQRGAYVRAGQVIALVGSTGQSTGPHLHFEVQDYGQAVNPVFFLKY